MHKPSLTTLNNIKFINRFNNIEPNKKHILISSASAIYNLLDHSNETNALKIIHFLMGKISINDLELPIRSSIKLHKPMPGEEDSILSDNNEHIKNEISSIMSNLFKSSQYFYSKREAPEKSIAKIRDLITSLENTKSPIF